MHQDLLVLSGMHQDLRVLSGMHQDLRVSSTWIDASAWRMNLLVLLGMHQDVHVSCTWIDAPSCWRRLVFTHQLVLDILAHNQVDGQLFPCWYPTARFSVWSTCSLALVDSLCLSSRQQHCGSCPPFRNHTSWFVIASCKYMYLTLMCFILPHPGRSAFALAAD